MLVKKIGLLKPKNFVGLGIGDSNTCADVPAAGNLLVHYDPDRYSPPGVGAPTSAEYST